MTTRGYVDGCFDIMHSGHYNAIRQARALCDHLVVGIHSDQVIEENKALPVMNQEERYELLSHVKWCDEILPDVPYSPSLETLALARADFAVHGDDLPVSADGIGTYDTMKEAGKLRVIKRTDGVSTTDLVGRLLTMTKQQGGTGNECVKASEVAEVEVPPGATAEFLTTTRRIAEFSSRRVPTEKDTIVYLDGDFDMFNISHARLLEEAKKEGTFLIVGVWGDETVKQLFDRHPVMSVHERVLNVSAMKHVDEVLIGAPTQVSRDLLSSLNVNVVCEGIDPNLLGPEGRMDHAKEVGVYRCIDVPTPIISVEQIAQRVAENRIAYIKRNAVRGQREKDYYSQREVNSCPNEI